MSEFTDKTVLVTGGRSGIGAAIANRFASQGAHVITAQRSADECHDHIICDLSAPEAGRLIINEVISRTSRLDVLVNNAGMMQEQAIEDITQDSWQTTLAVNLTAPFLLIQASLPYLRATKGAIVNISSIEARGANPLHAAYCASKAGLEGLTRAVAIDHGRDGIRCNAIAPGWIDTDLNDAFIDSQDNPAYFREMIAGIHPIGRTGIADEVAALACFLSSQDAGFITGQSYVIDGGRTSKLSLP